MSERHDPVGTTPRARGPLGSTRNPLAFALARSAIHGHGLYLGAGERGPLFAAPEHGALVLGPPRSGKTTALVVPNILQAAGSVLAVSTKRDVLDATARARAQLGEVLVFDPSGTITAPPGARRIGWSPIPAARSWDRAVLTAESMVGAAHAGARADATHWRERAGALLATLLHAAALDGSTMREVVTSVNRHEPDRALASLARHDAELALDLLVGITVTDEREQSGIWSTTSGALAAYRTEQALASSTGELFDPERFVAGRDTLYLAAPGEHQAHLAPLVAGVVRDIRSAAFSRSAAPGGFATRRTPVLLVLDELANIAPLHDLPALVAEGASQGVLTLACLQDLSQARARFGPSADGFLSLFGAKVFLPGIGDVRTLEALASLAGDREVTSVSRTTTGRLLRRRSSRTVASRREPRLAPALIANPRPGRAYAVLGAAPAELVLTPYYACSPWRELVAVRTRSGDRSLGR